MFQSGEVGAGKLTQDQRDGIRAKIVADYQDDPCFTDVRGNISWRVRDDYYRVEVVVADGCEDRAKAICKEIADMIEHDYRVRSSVWAFDGAGRNLANAVK